MRYWYGYTGTRLLIGHGRSIRQLTPNDHTQQRLLDTAKKQAITAQPSHTPHPSEETFIAAMIAPLAIQELGDTPPAATQFSSAAQLLKLFDGLNIEHAALHLLNGRIASAYAKEGDAPAIAARVMRAFAEGDLLILPRDTTRLHAPETLQALPGAVAFLFSRSLAQRKAFDAYLRRGAPPLLAHDVAVSIAKSRPTLRTWEREARLEKGRHRHELCC